MNRAETATRPWHSLIFDRIDCSIPHFICLMGKRENFLGKGNMVWSLCSYSVSGKQQKSMGLVKREEIWPKWKEKKEIIEKDSQMTQIPELVCMCGVQSLSQVRLLVTPWTVACQAPHTYDQWFQQGFQAHSVRKTVFPQMMLRKLVIYICNNEVRPLPYTIDKI